MKSMTISDDIQDFVEYLVEYQGVRGLQDLTREEREKLSFMMLLENRMYMKLIRSMHTVIKSEVSRYNNNNSGESYGLHRIHQ
jgi:hypothetical protein